jgi:iron complex outermembrane recepter protein
MAMSLSAVAQVPTAGAAASEQPAALEEIVVTAQKRSESAQSAPADITVISSQDLVDLGVDNLKVAENLIPSTKLNYENGATQVFIRGVGSQLDYTWIPESVSVNLDGIYASRFSTSGAFYDIQQIEVLPGPQGTLYGRAAIGGVVNVISNRPTQELSTDALVEYGNYATKHVTLVENVPLSSNWSVRGALDYLDNDGYDNNGTYDTDSLAGRLSSLYRGTDFTAFLTGSFYWNRDRPAPVQYAPYPNGNAYYFPPTDTAQAFFYPPNGISNNDSTGWDENSNFAGQFDWNLGPATLSYIPGALRSVHEDTRVAVGFFLPLRTAIDQYSNELRLSANDSGQFTWIAGLYQFYKKSLENYTFGPNLAGAIVNSREESYAAYGQGTYSVTNRARLTLGVRTSADQVSADNSEVVYPTGAPPAFGRGTIPFEYSNRWTKVGWKLGGEYDIAAKSLLYANIQTGFNPGSFNATAPIQGTTIGAQTMLGYTAGLKNEFWDGRVRLNLEGYLYNYDGLVTQAQNLATGDTQFLNAPHVQITGTQLDFAIAPIDDLKLHATVGYLHAVYSEFSAGNAAGTGAQNYAGFQLPYSPEGTASVGGEYTVRLAAAGSIGLRVDSYISSSYWTIFNQVPGAKQEAYTKTDASVTYYSPSFWDVGLYAKNIENVATFAAGATTGRPYPYAVGEYVEPPRLYGIRFHLKLGSTR